jgi:hypothetical protein
MDEGLFIVKTGQFFMEQPLKMTPTFLWLVPFSTGLSFLVGKCRFARFVPATSAFGEGAARRCNAPSRTRLALACSASGG